MSPPPSRHVAALPARALLLVCVAALALACKTDSSCEKDCMCHYKGWCGSSWGSCEATRDEHCRKSEICKLNGLCTAKEGTCVAGKDEDCKSSRACQHLGACRAEGGRCKE